MLKVKMTWAQFQAEFSALSTLYVYYTVRQGDVKRAHVRNTNVLVELSDAVSDTTFAAFVTFNSGNPSEVDDLET